MIRGIEKVLGELFGYNLRTTDKTGLIPGRLRFFINAVYRRYNTLVYILGKFTAEYRTDIKRYDNFFYGKIFDRIGFRFSSGTFYIPVGILLYIIYVLYYGTTEDVEELESVIGEYLKRVKGKEEGSGHTITDKGKKVKEGLSLRRKEGESNDFEYITVDFGSLIRFSRDRSLAELTKDLSPNIKTALIYSYPLFTVKKLRKIRDIDMENLLDTMNTQPFTGKIYFRIVPRHNTTFGEIYKRLTSSGIEFVSDSDFYGLYSADRKYIERIISTSYYKRGEIIFCDKSSFAAVYTAVSYLIDNTKRPGPTGVPIDFRKSNGRLSLSIWDMCAAPGIKSLLLSDMLSYPHLFFGCINRRKKISGVLPRSSRQCYPHRILCGDYSPDRMGIMKSYLSSFGGRIPSSEYGMAVYNGYRPPYRNDIKFDAVLVDAPCTGSGILGLHPELKWRQNIRFLGKHVRLQRRLLDGAAGFVRSGGILVYSNCSLYPEEGEIQAENFLERYGNTFEPFRPDKLPPCYTGYNSCFGRYLPHRDGTNGFFIAAFIKKGYNSG